LLAFALAGPAAADDLTDFDAALAGVALRTLIAIDDIAGGSDKKLAESDLAAVLPTLCGGLPETKPRSAHLPTSAWTLSPPTCRSK
jgi:hypothetical protein